MRLRRASYGYSGGTCWRTIFIGIASATGFEPEEGTIFCAQREATGVTASMAMSKTILGSVCDMASINLTRKDQPPLTRACLAAGVEVGVMEIPAVGRPTVGCIAWLGLGLIIV